jgi:TolB protein
MTTTLVALRALLDGGVQLRPHEAVAIVQQLLYSNPEIELARPFGPPTIDTLVLFSDGRVGSQTSAALPAVSEIGRLLDAMLPRTRGSAVPGGLRYAIARALLEVDAPPFDSVDELSASLARFETGDRAGVVRGLLARAIRPAPRLVLAPPPVPAPTPAPAPAAVTAMPVPITQVDASAPSPRPRRTAARAAAVAASVLLSFGLGWFAARMPVRPANGSRAATTPIERPQTPLPERPPVEVPNRSDSRSVSGASATLVNASATSEMYSPAFSADGRTVFFHTGGTRAPQSALMKRSAGTGRATPIVADGARNYHVQPSPDGTRLAYDSDRDGERAVYVAAADGTNVRRVSGSGYAAVPTWSPDGERLAFVRAEPSKPRVWNLWVASPDGGAPQRLTRFAYGQTWSASWLPDGQHVCFSHEDRLIVLSLPDGRQRSYPTPVPGRIVRTPAVSPDGRRVVFQVWRDGVWILDLQTADMRRILADPTAEEFAWTPDGSRIAYHSRRSGRWSIEMLSPDASVRHDYSPPSTS